MQPATIGILILAAVGVLAAGAYILQQIEANRRERLRQLTELRDKTKRAQGFIDDISSVYLSTEIREFLLTYLQSHYTALLKLSPREPGIRDALRHIGELQQEEYNHQLDQPKPFFKDVITAKRGTETMKDMVNFFIEIHNDGTLDKAPAKNFVDQGKLAYMLIMTETLMIGANNIAKQGNPRQALTRYQQCKEKLKPFVDQDMLPLRRLYIDDRIKYLKEKIQATQQLVAEVQQGKDNLAKEWEDFEAEQKGNDEHIRQDYE